MTRTMTIIVVFIIFFNQRDFIVGLDVSNRGTEVGSTPNVTQLPPTGTWAAGAEMTEPFTETSTVDGCPTQHIQEIINGSRTDRSADEERECENKRLSPSPTTSRGIDYVGYVFVPVFCLLGLGGNVLTILVMTSRGFRHLPVSLLLVALALSDTGVNLLFPFNKPFVRRLLGTDIRALSLGGCRLFFWAYRYFKTTSSWMVVLISTERFVAVWFHIKAKQIASKRNVLLAIATVYFVFAVYIGYWCSFADRIINGACIPNTKPPGLERQAEVFLVMGLSFYAFIPSGLLVLLNTLIVYKLVKLHINKRNKVEDATSIPKNFMMKSTTMLIGIAVAFVVLVTPVSGAHLYSFAVGVNIFQTTEPRMVFFREVTQIMEQMNNSINFLLYIMCSKRFRVQLLQALKLHLIIGKHLENEDKISKTTEKTNGSHALASIPLQTSKRT